MQVDLTSLASVRACVDASVAVGKPFGLVIANAGIMAGPKRMTIDGFETQFGTNYLGHFVLINRIASLLRPGGRVVMVASAGHRRTDVDLDDPNFERNPYHEYIAYGRSKTATVLFAVEFDQRHSGDGIRATAVHPGSIMTETIRRIVEELGDGKDQAIAAYDWKTPSQGAATAIWAGIVAPADEVGGRYVRRLPCCRDHRRPEVQGRCPLLRLRFGSRRCAGTVGESRGDGQRALLNW